jgi:hypothetical protein
VTLRLLGLSATRASVDGRIFGTRVLTKALESGHNCRILLITSPSIPNGLTIYNDVSLVDNRSFRAKAIAKVLDSITVSRFRWRCACHLSVEEKPFA